MTEKDHLDELLNNARERDMWKDIATAPKDGTSILLFGLPTKTGETTFSRPVRLTGYWDEIDSSWCSTTADWTGPFVDATHWQPLPAPPKP